MYPFGIKSADGGPGQARPALVVAVIGALATLTASAPLGSAARDAPVAHPFRLSIADVSVGERTLEVRIRLFWDDLQFAVMDQTGDMSFALAENPAVDAIVVQYINDTFVLEHGGHALPGELIERGVDTARRLDEVMWWYRLEYPLSSSAGRIHIRNRLLFNMFEDQRNLVVIKTRSGRERTYFFSWDRDNRSVGID